MAEAREEVGARQGKLRNGRRTTHARETLTSAGRWRETTPKYVRLLTSHSL